MELKDFVKTTILEIYSGIEEAQGMLKKVILPIGADVMEGVPFAQKTSGIPGKPVPLANLQFEIVLTENNTDGAKGGIGVFLGNIGVGAKGHTEESQTNLSRIKFNIPIVLSIPAQSPPR